MTDRFHLVCVNYKNYLGQGDRYVAKFWGGAAAAFSGLNYQPVQLTEAEIGDDAEGWWAKLAMFEPGRFEHPVVFVDLDTIFTGRSCQWLADLACSGDFYMLSDFFQPQHLASGVMAWTPSERTEAIWRKWDASGRPQIGPRGDGGWIEFVTREFAKRIQDVAPGEVASFKAGDGLGNTYDKASIVAFHGRPRPHEVADLMKHW